MSYENACDVICVHEDKVSNALSLCTQITSQAFSYEL
ncbi:hypothetical protein HMPREF9281_01728 [Staphylococcus epidermidis BVS058A4]|nr:hypothetical protein HMPREF9281_01728 [Staphylococcus epidermidis BVS058A4]